MRIATPYKHPKSGIYYFRRAVPIALRNNINRTIIKVSLGTRNPGEAVRLFASKQIECEDLFESARHGSDTRQNKLLLRRKTGNVYEQDSSVTLQYLFNKLNQERQVSKKTLDESQKVINRFNDINANINAVDISGRIIREFKELLIRTPSILSRDLRLLPLTKIVNKIDSNHSVKTLSDSTINKHLSVISSVLEWASNNSYFSDNWHNPVRGKTIKRKGLKRDRMPFTVDDLHKMFSSDIYIKQSRPKGGGGGASYWIPVIGLYTGMRLEEIGQLLVSDIKRDGDIWYFDINDFESKQLKNKSSIRRVPIHQALLDLGFIYYINSLESVQLFPLLRRDKYGKLTQNWSKWFGRRLRKIGVIDSSKVFHSFRHSMKDALRGAEVDEAISDAITGHSSTSVGRNYGSGYNLTVLNKAIQKISYDVDALRRLTNPQKDCN